jgi:hypothetical protein
VADLAGNAIDPPVSRDVTFFDLTPDVHWSFDEGQGTVAHDQSPLGYDATLEDGAGWGDGLVSGSLQLDGVDGHADAGAFDLAGSAVTISGWVNADSFAHLPSQDARIVSKAVGTAEQDHYFMLSTITSGGGPLLRFRLKTGGVTTTLIASSGTVATGTWVHATAVYDGIEMRLYKDGVQVGSVAASGELSIDPGVSVWIGSNPPDATSKPFDGRLDDLRIYSRALSAGEIATLYEHGSIGGASGAGVFSDGFESGDPSSWSSVVQ